VTLAVTHPTPVIMQLVSAPAAGGTTALHRRTASDRVGSVDGVGEQLTDWVAWHRPYADPSSQLSRRRRTVQRHVGDWLGALPASGLPGRIVSACAGDGRDVLEVLTAMPDVGAEVDVLLVELDAGLAADATTYAEAHGLARVTVRVHDAGGSDGYAGAVPAGLMLLCGVFGNITDDDVRGTIAALPSLCAPGGTVLWTRGRDEDGGLAAARTVRSAFAGAGFEELSFTAPDDAHFGVGVHRLAVDPERWVPGQRLFSFVR
jgi:hypothetical protein